jgi:hypothetical protein
MVAACRATGPLGAEELVDRRVGEAIEELTEWPFRAMARFQQANASYQSIVLTSQPDRLA